MAKKAEVPGVVKVDGGPFHIQDCTGIDNTITLKVPVAEFPPGAYCSPRLDLTLSHQQAQTLKRIVAGLDRAGARLKTGARVVSGADAVRFMLEQG